MCYNQVYRILINKAMIEGKRFQVISFNAQSIWGNNSIQDVFKLVEDAKEKSLFCLQEISKQMQEHLREFSKLKKMSFHSSGENVILIPQELETKRLNDITLPYQRSPLVHLEVTLEQETVHLVSGKLTHGIFLTRTLLRTQQLKKVLSHIGKKAVVVALDANASSKYEQWFHDIIAQKRWFWVTKNNMTYVLERIEDKNIPHIFAKFWGRVFKTKSELDRMFFAWVHLLESKVHDAIVSSDHIPVTSYFHLPKAK